MPSWFEPPLLTNVVKAATLNLHLQRCGSLSQAFRSLFACEGDLRLSLCFLRHKS